MHQFHVDNLSSAHVYLRLRESESWEKIPQAILDDCAQLTKANSIEGQQQLLTSNAAASSFSITRKQKGQRDGDLHAVV